MTPAIPPTPPTPPSPSPAEQLLELLETLPAGNRQQITAWLLGLGRGAVDPTWSLPGPPTGLGAVLGRPGTEERLRRLAATLPAGEESQLVTIRLGAERHAELRAWCARHGFTMAAVVRGLVERFLEEHGSAAPAT
jgi:hypothetical protein